MNNMMNKIFFLFVCIVCAVSNRAFAQAATKADADSAYLKNDYQTAIEIYEGLLKQGEAAELYYNLGNSYYKVDNLGKAILNYERALLLEPGNDDIRTNLQIAKGKTIDKVIPVPELFLISWINVIINVFSMNTWAIIGICAFFVFLLSLSFYIWSKRVGLRKIGFFMAVVLLLVVVVSIFFASQQKDRLINRFNAIVLSPSITIRSTPSDSGTSLFILHEGHKVVIKDDSMREWKEIVIEDGKVGWIPTSAIEII